ncbi:hypothetical protein [Allochromatium vinosum]|uniref:Uncharacterized protein n=1 Tax=Allochromatium vinosum (strain ATCC 17899 / DSM 180 / NBRC 103801 / NCIMB 10441 / D) TaxID=572477 RepID=D3RNB7_ALLVD|nr:hypothetical protein [Allochromatium vinosum]ADC61401.1 conserved hypothetical protein [Allochromatium vinosum DSM 180]
MDRSIVLSILGAAVLGFVGMLLLMPDPIEDEIARLPWLIEQDADGRTQVFGFTLGATTLAEVRQVFREDGEVNLFRTLGPSGTLAAEVYFEQIHLERLRADFVLTLDVDQTTLAAMYERGLRISQTGSGSQKVKLDPSDTERLAERPIRAIVYLPKARLDAALIEQRFGTPSRRLTESETGIVHWLYPKRGLDIGRDPNGRVVMQYVNPADFGAILEPLTTSLD